jgi:hypothetical protein
LKARQLPTFREFLRANRETIVAPYLLFYAAMTVLVWMFEQTVHGTWPVPLHWVPEIGFMLEAGEYLAKLKQTLLPTELMIMITAMGLTVYAVSLFEFSLLGHVIAAIFVTPLVFGYGAQRVLTWKKTGAPKSGT